MRSSASRAASDWCAANGQESAAITYAQAARDIDQVARLIVDAGRAVVQSGRASTLDRWLGWLQEHGDPTRYPPAATLAGIFYALGGEASRSDRWLAAAEQPRPDTALEAIAAAAPMLAFLRALRCRDGVTAMHADAALAVQIAPAGSPWGAQSRLLLAWAERWIGRPLQADDLLSDTCDEARAASTADRTSFALQVAYADRASLAIDRGEWSAAADFLDQAKWAARHSRFDEMPLNSLLHAVAARIALHADNAAEAAKELVEAQRLLPRLTHAMPQAAVHVRLQLARAYLAMADQAGARTMLGEVDAIVRRVPELGTLLDGADEVREQLTAGGLEASGISTLTTAELRILPLMATHLTYREIGERRFLSAHTVKSHAMSIYRKFGVRSRSEAVERARAVGLL